MKSHDFLFDKWNYLIGIAEANCTSSFTNSFHVTDKEMADDLAEQAKDLPKSPDTINVKPAENGTIYG